MCIKIDSKVSIQRIRRVPGILNFLRGVSVWEVTYRVSPHSFNRATYVGSAAAAWDWGQAISV